MASETIPATRRCPCRCGWTTGVYDLSYGALAAMDRVKTCRHEGRIHTLARGIDYCDHCMHWIGTRAAFAKLSAGDDRERHLYAEVPHA